MIEVDHGIRFLNHHILVGQIPMPFNISGIKHWMPLQWYGFIITVSFIGVLITVILGYRIPGWPLVLVINGLLAFFSIFFIAWPDRDGFSKIEND